MSPGADQRWMAAALALAERGRGRATPNPNVGCVLVRQDETGARVVGRGWTQPGGRPHAEAMALGQAGAQARGATAYVTLEPCAHASSRGPACADGLIAAGVARVVVALTDPDPRTKGQGIERLCLAGVETSNFVSGGAARAAMAGWLSRVQRGRPHVTLKLATSLDGCIAMADGTSRWITGDRARAHAHLLRARCDAILVGRATRDADAPALDVRLAGLESRSPRRLLLTRGRAPDGWDAVPAPAAIAGLADVNDLLVEGGAATAAAFLAEDRVDTLILYRAPILIGAGRPCLADIGLANLDAAHGRWHCADARQLGKDRVEVYQRVREG